MADERWISPFKNSLAYYLFIKHFSELNEVYWSHVPASDTIIKHMKEKVYDNPSTDFCKLFIVKDENERRIASDYNEWLKNYKEFLNYTRLNMPKIHVSSTEIRERVSKGLPLDGLTTKEVEKYIYEHNLYKNVD